MQGLASSYNAHLSHGGPPVLPMYKSLVRKRAPQKSIFTTIPIIIFLCGFLGFFFCSIYIGATYLHDHLQDEKWGSTIGLPGTRNIIKKWSLAHLGGIDLTALGPPGGRGASKVTGNMTSKIKVLFKSAFSSKSLVKSAALEEKVDPYNQKGVIAEANTVKNTDPPEDLFEEVALPVVAVAEIEENGEEKESMDGDTEVESITTEENEEEKDGNEGDLQESER